MAAWTGTANVNRGEASFSRSLMGISYVEDSSAMWINLCHGASGQSGGWKEECDADGYINQPGLTSRQRSWALQFMPPRHGPQTREYELRGRGDCDVEISGQGDGLLWAYDAANSVGVTSVLSARKWRVKHQNTNSSRHANPPWKIRITRTDHQTQYSPWYGTGYAITNTDYEGTGNYAREIACVAVADLPEYMAGQFFRKTWKDNIIHDNHAWLRCQAWNGVLNFTAHGNYRDRARPGTDISWGFNQENLLKYGAASMTNSGWVKYSVAAVAGTPANQVHGEVVWCDVPTDWATENGSNGSNASKVRIESVTNEVNAKFKMQEDRNFHVGDKVQACGFFGNSGMTEINDRFFTITSVQDARNFTTDLNTSTYSAYRHRPLGPAYNPATDDPPSDGAKDASIGIPIFMKVGTGGDRDGPDGKGYPCIGMGGYYPASGYTSALGGPGNKRTFIFDKQMGGYRNSAGVVQWGVWRVETAVYYGTDGNYYPGMGTVPIEFQVQMINELMDRIDETGQKRTKGPINLHICIPVLATNSLAPGVNPLDLYGPGMVNTIINGTNGFRGLDRRCKATIEWGNEQFNFTSAIYNGQYSLFTSAWRWGSNDWTNGGMLINYRHFWDIEQAYPDLIIPKKSTQISTVGKRIFFLISTWPFGLKGVAGGTYGGGDAQIFGTPTTTAYMNNAAGQTPPTGTATPYPWPQDKISGENIHWVSPGGYLIPTTNGEEGGVSWDSLHMQPNCAAWVAAGDVRQIASYNTNIANSYYTDIHLTTAPSWPVGAAVTFTDVAQTPPVLDLFGDNTHPMNYVPCRIISISGTTVTVDFDIGSIQGFATSGKMMRTGTPGQQTACADYSKFMELTPGPLDNYNLVSWHELMRDRMLPAMNAGLPELRILSYEAWIQIQTGIGVAGTGYTKSQNKAFNRDVIMCNAMATYMTQFLSNSRTLKKVDSMSVLTQMLWENAQWGMQPLSPYTFSPDTTVEWGGKGAINLALAAFNNVNINYDPIGDVPGTVRTINWVP